MSNFILVHAGTKTYFAVDEDAFVLDVSALTDAEFEQFFQDKDIDPVVEKYGYKLSDEFFDKGLENESNCKKNASVIELCEICESNEKEAPEGKWCTSCKDDFKESD